jgi:uncharacterized protein with von Willebrand factor type A (vWA) domain
MLLGNLLAFGRLLRRLGLDVHPGRMLDVTEALTHIDIRVRDDVYHTCRALLVHRHEDLPVFDRAFEAFWRRHRNRRAGPPGHAGTDPADVADNRDAGHGARGAPGREAHPVGTTAPDDDAAPMDGVGMLRTWSDAEGLANRDFAMYTDAELALARAALDRLVWHPGERRTRRWIRGAGPRLDIRRALQQSVRTGGDIVELPRRRRAWHQRPLVLLCDISGSMERYSRMLLHFAHALGRRHRRVETFLFSTRLTRVTTALRLRGLDAAVATVSRAVPDWSGGTRIGDALRVLHLRWRSRVLHGGPVVLLVSDGWDRGDPLVLRDQMARLQRNCHRLIWLNPLIGTEDYAPLTRGLQAALPFVDDFLPARTLLNLADLAGHLNRLRA